MDPISGITIVITISILCCCCHFLQICFPLIRVNLIGVWFPPCNVNIKLTNKTERINAYNDAVVYTMRDGSTVELRRNKKPIFEWVRQFIWCDMKGGSGEP